MSEAVRDSIRVNAPPSVVMDVVTDLESYPEWQDEMKAVEVLETDEQGRPRRARLTVDAKIFTTTYTLRYRYEDSTMSWELEEADQLEALSGAYRVSEVGDGACEVVYELTVVPKMRLPALVRRQAARRIIDAALTSMKRRVESGS